MIHTLDDSQEWFTEVFQNYAQSLQIKKKLFDKQTEFQQISIFETTDFGNLMLLDDKIMLTERFEFIYHEMITHVAFAVNKNIKNVLVIGGGDGGTVREILKYDIVESVDLVEIDEEVINVSKEFFPEVAADLEHPKLQIRCEDGIKYVEDSTKSYDLVIIDSTDPENFALALFRKDFFEKVQRILSPEGILINQTDNPFLCEESYQTTYQELGEVFPKVFSFMATCIDYPGITWSFGFSSKTLEPNRIQGGFIPNDLKYYNQDIHLAAFCLPNKIRQLLPESCLQKSPNFRIFGG